MQQDMSDNDFTWNMTNVCIWTGAEIEAAIICACLPTLKPILNLIKTGELFPTRPLDSSGGSGHIHNHDHNNRNNLSNNAKVSFAIKGKNSGTGTSSVTSTLSRYCKKFSIAPLSFGGLSSVTASSRSRGSMIGDTGYDHEREGSFTQMINIVKTYEVTSEEHLHINDPSGFISGGGADDDGGGCDRIADGTGGGTHQEEDTQIYHQPQCEFTPHQQGWNTISTSGAALKY
jgi:hypothetical protein